MATHPKHGWLLAAGALALAVFIGEGWVRHGPPAWLRVDLPDPTEINEAAARATIPPPVKKKTDPEEDHIRKAGDLVCDFGCCYIRQPRDMAEVRDWAVRQGKARPEDFCSTRDGCPYDFLNRSRAIVEHAGRDGRRFAYDPAMGPVELTEGVLAVLADSGVVKRVTRPQPEKSSGPGRCCPTSAPPPE